MGDYAIKYGSANHKIGGVTVQVEQEFVHPDYKDYSDQGNIAVLKLAQEIVFSSVAQPVKFANSDPKTGELLRISGWGAQRKSDYAVYPDLLHAMDASAIGHNECKKLYEPVNFEGFFVWPDQFCSGNHAGNGNGACHEDEGAPVVNERNELVGILAGNYHCGKLPEVHTSVNYHMEFIMKSVLAA